MVGTAERSGTGVKLLKILFLSSGKRAPSSRFRIQPYVREFRKEGHRCVIAHSFPAKYDYFPWMGFRPSQLLKRSVRWWHWLQARLRRFDIVYVEREIFDSASWDMEERFRSLCRSMVLDIDDAVFLRYPEKFNRIVPLADLVVCGNRFIEEDVRSLRGNAICVPTCIDLARYPERLEHSEVENPVVGWMGSAGNLQYLEVAAEALRTVAAEKRFRLRLVVPDRTPLASIDLSGVDIEHHPWTAKTELAELHAMDIGLMPLFADHAWDRYKCGAKLLQYLAVGVPGIATPVGVNADILSGDQAGFAASTTKEWCRTLMALLNDPTLRQRMGQTGRTLVRDQYSIQANYPKLAAALQNLTNARG